MVGGPLLLGVLVAAASGWFLLRPALQRIQTLEQRRDELEQVQSSLPLLDQRIQTSLDALRLAQQQQTVLVSLLAGSGSVQTFLALLDDDTLSQYRNHHHHYFWAKSKKEDKRNADIGQFVDRRQLP